MREYTESEFRILCDLYRRSEVIYDEIREDVLRLSAEGMVFADDGIAWWDLTLDGRAFVDRRGLELAKPDFGDLSAMEKMVFLDQKMFPESDRRRLLFDPDESVAVYAIRHLDLTEKEFIWLGDSPYPAVRAEALGKGIKHLKNGEDLDRKLSNYLRHDDGDTVKAVREALKATGNSGFTARPIDR